MGFYINICGLSLGYIAIFVDIRSNFTEGLDTGAAFCAFHKGKPIVDIWGGFKDTTTREMWEKDTMTMAMSTTKVRYGMVFAPHLSPKNVMICFIVS